MANRNWQLDKQGARDYAEEHASKFGLVEEVLSIYDNATRFASDGWERGRFYREAEDALYEWDI